MSALDRQANWQEVYTTKDHRTVSPAANPKQLNAIGESGVQAATFAVYKVESKDLVGLAAFSRINARVEMFDEGRQ